MVTPSSRAVLRLTPNPYLLTDSIGRFSGLVPVRTRCTYFADRWPTSIKSSTPVAASFDGQRVLVTNSTSVTVFKAADLSFIANVATGVGSQPHAACSDGINFWVPLQGKGKLLRF
jgi:DNA-binding beta-propeller fold protein YncE